ncbi:hypothetical protein BDW72DRAFT_192450 [Aspergillus terricola var. indicus]
MISLEASAIETSAAIEILDRSNEVAIAAHNTPTQTVASGNVNAVEILGAHFASQGRRCKMLNVSQAFHSHHMDGMLADFQSIAETVRFQHPTIPIISGLTGQLAAPGQLEQPDYWARNLCYPAWARLVLQVREPQPTMSIRWPGYRQELRRKMTPQQSNAVSSSCICDMYLSTGTPSSHRSAANACSFRQDPAANQLTEQTGRARDLRHALAVADPEQHAEIVLGVVQEIVAEILGVVPPNAIDMELPLQDMGIDSFTAVMMQNRLSVVTSLDLSATVVFARPNLRGLCHSPLDQLQKDLSDVDSSTSPSGGQTPATTASESISFDEVFLSTPLGESKSTDGKCPLHRVLCPALGMNPPGTPSQLFESTLGYFSSLSWCHRLIYEGSSTSTLPGYGQAIPFIAQCFNPASPEHDHGITSKAPPLRNMLFLFRLADASHLGDPLRPILRVTSLFALGSGTSGHRGILHGGFTATLLDESISIIHEINAALGKTGSVFSGSSVTASLSIRYLAPILITEPAVCVAAWVEDIQEYNTRMKAVLMNSRGERLAEAEAVFVAKLGL